eukprot:PhF_6_TR11596/c0_g1_i1/m.18774
MNNHNAMCCDDDDTPESIDCEASGQTHQQQNKPFRPRNETSEPMPRYPPAQRRGVSHFTTTTNHNNNPDDPERFQPPGKRVKTHAAPSNVGVCQYRTAGESTFLEIVGSNHATTTTTPVLRLFEQRFGFPSQMDCDFFRVFFIVQTVHRDVVSLICGGGGGSGGGMRGGGGGGGIDGGG